jgi:porphobilinogen deaminase
MEIVYLKPCYSDDELPGAFLCKLVHSDTLCTVEVRMGVLNLRDVPEDLIVELKISAARNRMTLKDWCVFKLSHKCSEIKPGEAAAATGNARRK